MTRWQWTVPAVVLLAGLAFTGIATYTSARANRLEAMGEFEAEAQQAQAAIVTRMEAYLALLRGGASFLAANPALTRNEFHSYVQRLRIPHYYPGIQGIGLTLRVAPQEREALVEFMKAQGVENFRIWPDYERDEYHAIVYLEPQDRRNRAAIGYDMFSEPVRRLAMEQARDTGTAAASGKVTLVQEIEGPSQAGFLVYVPVYTTGEVPETVEERRAKLRGFVYSPFRADDLFDAIFDDRFPTRFPFVPEREIFDGATTDPNALLHRRTSDDPLAAQAPKAVSRLLHLPAIPGHVWTVRLSIPQAPAGGLASPSQVALGGLALSFLIFGLTRAQVRARRDAEESAMRLRESEMSLKEARRQLERHASQLELRVAERTAQLEDSLQALEGVLYHVAHDLRAPLRAMASFTSILQEEYPDRLDERGSDYIRRIADGARRMDQLVQDLLAYGRLTHAHLELKEVSLDEEIQAALARLRQPISAAKAEVTVDRPLPGVRADPAVLGDAIGHLVLNAVKFRSEARPPKVRIRATDGKMVRLWVEDNGIGIRPEYLDRIFRMFERLHGYGEYGGTGIGLAIVRKGVERMGGRVGVESTPGQGSRFWLELPRAEREGTAGNEIGATAAEAPLTGAAPSANA